MIKAQAGVLETDSVDDAGHKLKAAVADLLPDLTEAEWVESHLRPLAGVSAETTGSPDRQNESFTAWRRFFESMAERRPLVLVFEDIHWADANLLDLIDTLATHVRGLPMLLVTLARPEFLDTREGWGAGLSGYTALTLGPLNEQQARELAVRRLGDDVRADEVIQVAEGNPLFIEQIAASIGETAPGKLPTSVRGIVAARLDALPRPERALLLDAAVIGKVFWLNALHTLNPQNSDLMHLLDELERRDLVRRETVSIIEGQQQFAFTHVVIRDVAYDLLPRADRARRHALAAEFFETSTGVSGEAIGALARHWRNAGDHKRAVQQLVRSAEQAERGWAKDHAALLYREALELVPPEDTERKSMLRRRLALASAASFHVPDVKRQESPRA
jgi:predicted ATPase